MKNGRKHIELFVSFSRFRYQNVLHWGPQHSATQSYLEASLCINFHRENESKKENEQQEKWNQIQAGKTFNDISSGSCSHFHTAFWRVQSMNERMNECLLACLRACVRVSNRFLFRLTFPIAYFTLLCHALNTNR